MGFNVQCILVNHGSLAEGMYWKAFVGLKVPKDLMRSCAGVLVNFAGSKIEIRGYADLETTFGNKEAKTLTI